MQEGEVSPCAPKQSLSATPSAGSNAARNACLGKNRQRRVFSWVSERKREIFLRWYFDCGENNAGRNVGIEKNNYQV